MSMKYTFVILPISPICYTHVWDILELSDLSGCACELHSGRVGFAGPFPEESVQRCDAGDLQEPHCYR